MSYRKLALSAVFTALAVLGSFFYVPILGAKCAPIQHVINILGAVFLGPFYTVLVALCASIIRNLLGIGTIFAFPGSMFGAFLASFLYKYRKEISSAILGELIGTSLLGAIASFFIAWGLLGNTKVALFTFVFPFFVSSAGGVVIGTIILLGLKRSGALQLLMKDRG